MEQELRAQKLFKLLVQTRAMQLYAHSCHLLSARSPFFSDHEALKNFYEAHEADFDSVAERILGNNLDSLLHLSPLMQAISQKINPLPCHEVKENKIFFQELQKLEKELQVLCQSICTMPEITEGTKQLVGDIANNSEKRSYMISRRLK